jgi:hypothetical protein
MPKTIYTDGDYHKYNPIKTRWHKIGLFRNEDEARKLVPQYFKDVNYQAHFIVEGKKDALYVSESYWRYTNGLEVN